MNCLRSCDKYAFRVLHTYFPDRHVCWFKMICSLLFPNVHVCRFNDVMHARQFTKFSVLIKSDSVCHTGRLSPYHIRRIPDPQSFPLRAFTLRNGSFLGLSVKLRNATVSFVTSVCPQLVSKIGGFS